MDFTLKDPRPGAQPPAPKETIHTPAVVFFLRDGSHKKISYLAAVQWQYPRLPYEEQVRLAEERLASCRAYIRRIGQLSGGNRA